MRPWSGKDAIPTLAVMRTFSPYDSRNTVSAIRSRMRSAMIWAPSGPVCGRMTVNSSPPKREATSISRTVLLMTAPTSTSVRLPHRWPC